jgi:hypothetical protein
MWPDARQVQPQEKTMERREPNFPVVSPGGLGWREAAKWVAIGTIAGLLATSIWAIWGNDLALSLRAYAVQPTTKPDCR